MANVFQAIATAGTLKNVYEGKIVDQLSEDLPIYRAIEKVKKAYSGLQVVRPLRVRRNQGIGATSDGGTLPAIGTQTTIQATVAAKYNYLRFGITGPMIKASQNDIGSFVRQADYELQQGYKDLSSDENRQLSWDGTGDLATLSAAAAGVTSLSIAGRESTEAALKFIDVGLVFDIYTTGGTLVQSGVTVTAVSGTPLGASATLTVTPAVTASSGDIIVRSGSFGQEVQGLLYSLDGATSSIYGVDRSVYISYQGNVLNNASAQLTIDAMQNAFNQALERGGRMSLNAVYTDYATLRFYQKLLVPDKRYVNSMEGDGTFGKKGKFYLDFNGIPVVPDKDCPRRLFFLQADSWKNYVLSEMEFADETGSQYIAQTSADSFECRVRHFFNLFPEQPSANAVLTSYISP